MKYLICRVSQKSPYIRDYVCQYHVDCAFFTGCSLTSTSHLVRNTSRLFEFVNTFGNSVVFHVVAVFPVKVNRNLSTAS